MRGLHTLLVSHRQESIASTPGVPPQVWALVAAAPTHGGLAIGQRGQLPWRCPADMALFRAATSGSSLIMGRATWDSIGRTSLRGLDTHVVSKDPASWRQAILERGASPHASIPSALDHIRRHARPESGIVWNCGGRTLYQDALSPGNPWCLQGLILSLVDAPAEMADTFLPPLPEWLHPVAGVRLHGCMAIELRPGDRTGILLHDLAPKLARHLIESPWLTASACTDALHSAIRLAA